MEYKVKVKFCTGKGVVGFKTYPQFFKLPENYTYSVGFDSSHTNTGVAVKIKEEDRVAIIFEIENPHRLIPRGVYIEQLIYTLDHVFQGAKIDLIVAEEPYGKENFMNLKTLVSRIQNRVKAFQDSEFKTILPNVWRSGFLDKAKYKGRFTRDKVKSAVMEEVLERHPQLAEFITLSGEDLDGFEALGVLEGYEAKNNDTESGLRKINTSMKDYSHKYTLKVICSTQDELVDNIKKEIGDILHFPIEVLKYAEDLTLEENAKRSTGEVKDKIIVSLIPYSKVYFILNWRKDEWVDETSPKRYFMVAYRQNITIDESKRF